LIGRESADLLAPLPNPPLMRDWGMMVEHMMFFVRAGARPEFANEPDPEAALEKAIAEGRIGLPENYFTVPRFYTCNPLNIMGHEAVLEWPSFSEVLDYELELGLVIGRTGRDIPEDKARDYMFGLTLFNDFTARDVQAAEGTPAGKSKDFEGSYSLGPCIATLDEFENIYDITTRLRLNGEEQTESSTNTMRITFERLIAYISEGCTLHTGEIFGSGTFENGSGTEKGRLLEEGDIIELEADGIGTLRNEIGRKNR
jgi:2-keto-4-pentenoate hydratase/2-oxohepta-3-ene-1,7-dioic acid hydratase in catechol pathway